MKSPDRFEKLGIRQVVKRRWMDQTLRCVLNGKDEDAIRKELTVMLAGDETKHGERGSEQYSKNIALLAAWFAPKDGLDAFVAQLVDVARAGGPDQWGALHWAVLAGSYPFFYSVTTVIGRLLATQEKVAKAQIQRRMEEMYGTPGMLERNLRYSIAILMDFGFLGRTEEKGVYCRGDLVAVDDDRVAMMLWKAALHATRGGKLSASALRNSPAFFPFAMPMIFTSQFRDAFEDVDTTQYVGVDEQIFLKEAAK